MNILILSSSHPEKTAGIVAKDLLNSLKKIRNNKVKLIVLPYDDYSDKDIASIEGRWEFLIKTQVRRVIKKIKKTLHLDRFVDFEYSVHDFDETITHYHTKRFLNKIGFKPDYIIVMFMTRFVSFKNLFELNKITSAKILLYPMDNAPFTGGCHWPWECRGFTEICGKCPALKSNHNNDLSRKNMLFKKKYVDLMEIEVISATSNFEKRIKQSYLFKNVPTHKIFIATNEELYKPGDKSAIRKKLNLPLNKIIIFFGGVSINGKRKGFSELYNALRKLQASLNIEELQKVHLLKAGREVNDFFADISISHTDLGLVPLSSLHLVFQASDIFVCPSIEDAGPMMINQSIMSGTPVVAFEMGVALDLVITGRTGYRAKLKDSEDLAKGIEEILKLSKTEYDKMCKNCRSLGNELLTPQKQVKQFVKIIEYLRRRKNEN